MDDDGGSGGGDNKKEEEIEGMWKEISVGVQKEETGLWFFGEMGVYVFVFVCV